MNNTTDNSDSVESNDTLIDVQLSSTHSIFMKMPKWIPLATANCYEAAGEGFTEQQTGSVFISVSWEGK